MDPVSLHDLGPLLMVTPVMLAWTSSTGGLRPRKASSSVRVLLVDGSSTFRNGLRHALEESRGTVVVDQCGSASEAIRRCGRLEVDVAVVDVDLPDKSGIELCHFLARERPEILVVLLGQRDWDVYLAAARAARAHGYLMRTAPTAELVSAIRDARRRSLFTPEQLDRISTWGWTVGRKLLSLRPREWEVLWLVAAGRTNREIAEELVLSENTVEKHVSAMLSKLGVKSRVALLAFLLENHLDVLSPAGQERKSHVQAWWDTVAPELSDDPTPSSKS
jgi:DNA-binding NarL/FixJ family response regulator